MTDKRSTFSENVSLLKDHHFLRGSNQGGKWRLIIRPYLVSKVPEIDEILKLVEANDDVPGLVRNLALHQESMFGTTVGEQGRAYQRRVDGKCEREYRGLQHAHESTENRLIPD